MKWSRLLRLMLTDGLTGKCTVCEWRTGHEWRPSGTAWRVSYAGKHEQAPKYICVDCGYPEWGDKI